MYLCRYRDASSALRRMFLPGACIGICGEHKSPISDRDLDRDMEGMSSLTKSRGTNGGVFGRRCVGELMHLVRRRDLSVLLLCASLVF